MSHRFDRRALPLADRHYNRRKVGSPQFVPPGRCLVLLSKCRRAVWVTSWPKGEYVRHRWPGAWVNSLFRNEGAGLSSELIREAVAATRWRYGDPPPLGMVTFVDAGEVRRKRDPGRCYLKAGFERDGMTEGGLHALRSSQSACLRRLRHAALPCASGMSVEPVWSRLRGRADLPRASPQRFEYCAAPL